MGRLDNVYIVVTLLAFLAFGTLGALDDWAKVCGNRERRGLSERAKLLGGTLTAGPDAGGGWAIVASLPRAGAPS